MKAYMYIKIVSIYDILKVVVFVLKSPVKSFFFVFLLYKLAVSTAMECQTQRRPIPKNGFEGQLVAHGC